MKKMNKGVNLPDQDHVIRYVSRQRLIVDGDNFLGFFPHAFKPRPIENNSISVNWIEFFDGDHATRIKKAIHGMRVIKNIGKTSAFGIGNVGNIKNISKKNGAVVKIVYAPNDGNPSHSLIRRLPEDNSFLLEALANDAFSERVLNSDIEE